MIFLQKNLFTARILQKCFKETLRKVSFQFQLKFEDITPVFKTNYRLQKNNYRLISVLPVISKILEKLRLMQNK